MSDVIVSPGHSSLCLYWRPRVLPLISVWSVEMCEMISWCIIIRLWPGLLTIYWCKETGPDTTACMCLHRKTWYSTLLSLSALPSCHSSLTTWYVPESQSARSHPAQPACTVVGDETHSFTYCNTLHHHPRDHEPVQGQAGGGQADWRPPTPRLGGDRERRLTNIITVSTASSAILMSSGGSDTRLRLRGTQRYKS